jgi:hydroxymethylpyrimidine pyrophosphatase-like HAD family hydrolase
VIEIKEAASFVTEKNNNESGVAEAIKQLLTIE